jgi:TolB-like protein/DNA-binding winged helix-turn-helix (wHTH) protein
MLLGREGQPVPLPSRAFDLLLYMVEHPGVLLEKRVLMKAVWPDVVVEENNLSQNIMLLRRSLGEEAGEHRYIVTVPGRGFRFVAPVTVKDAEPVSAAPTAAEMEAAGLRSLPSKPWLFASAAALAVFALGLLLWAHTDTPSIAVLAFQDMSPDKDQEHLSDGISEELSYLLGQMNHLRVVGRASSFSFKGRNQDLRAIGKALGVNHILDGSVRKAGDEIRVTATLIDATTGLQVWTETYSRRLENVFAIQEDISRSVATRLTRELRIGERNPDPGVTTNLEAYEAYLTGRALGRQGANDDDSLAGIAQLQRAVDLDSGYALAWAELAKRYTMASYILDSNGQWSKKSLQASSRALELAPESPRVLIAAADNSMHLRDWHEAERRLKKAASLASTTDYDVNEGLARFFQNVGRQDEALTHSIRALKADPLSSGASGALLVAYENKGQLADADAELARHKRNLGDANMRNEWLLTGTQLLHGIIRRDQIALGRFFSQYPRDYFAKAYQLGQNNPAAALAELKKLLQEPHIRRNAIPLEALAHWAVFYGDDELALDALRSAFGPSPATFLLWRPDFKGVRRLPGFKDIVRDLGLVEYWRTSGNWGDFCHQSGEDDFTCN